MYELNEPDPESGLYVAAFFSDETNNSINQYLIDNEIPNPVSTPGLHTTIVYSKIPVHDFEPNHSVNIDVNITYASLECWDMQDGKRCLVFHYFCPYLHIRFQEAMAAGATYDFDEYKPHVTFSYDVGPDFDVTTLPKPSFKMTIVGEYCESLDPD